jgi:3,4-dihydroxy-2-butanone 4-phosphate synthase
MTVLTAARRKKMPPSDFAMPGHRFPISDQTHARLAISGATRAERAGNISASQAAGIKAKARRKLGSMG